MAGSGVLVRGDVELAVGEGILLPPPSLLLRDVLSPFPTVIQRAGTCRLPAVPSWSSLL